MTDPLAPLPPVPTHLGEFRIESVLGEGGSGTVYAAQWGHREVALKVLRDAWLPSDGERRRFLDEARLLADVNHPGVVRILGFGELPDGKPYLAMERLEGESLAARLLRGALPVERSLELFDQLCQAVATLHGRGLIHRDIKPENVFLVRQERYAVLLDFGIAKPVDAPDSTVTREGGVRGTPAYMAPERFFGAAANTSTDIYELGVVLYTMVAGRLPWDGANDPVARLNPRCPSDLGITLPGALEERLLEALASRAEGRPATVADLAAGVARSVHEAPTASGARRTAALSTADARMTAPGKGQAPPAAGAAATTRPGKASDVAMAPTLRVTPPWATARVSPGASPTPRTNPTPIASYWSDSDPNIVLADLRSTGPGDIATACLDTNLDVITQTCADTASGGSHTPESPPNRVAGPLRAATLGVGLPTPVGTTPVVRPTRPSRLPAFVGGGVVAALVLVATTYLLTRPAAEQPLSVGAAGLVRPPDPTPGDATPPSRRPILAERDRLVWRTHPNDTQLLFRVSLDQLRASEVFKAILKANPTPVKIPQLVVLEKACQMDLMDRVEWLSIGLAGSTKKMLVDFMLRGTWTRDEVERCVATLGKAAGTPSKVDPRGLVTRVELGGSSFWIGWPDPKTLFLSNRDDADHGWMQQRLAGKRPAREALTLRQLYDRVDPGATAWAVIGSATFVDDELFQELPRPATAVVSLRVTKELKLAAVAQYDSARAALQARDGIRIKLHKIKSNIYVNTLLTHAEVTGTGKVAQLTVHLDQASALLFAQALSSFLESTDLSSVTPKPKPRPKTGSQTQ